jgi:hypothetical protein
MLTSPVLADRGWGLTVLEPALVSLDSVGYPSWAMVDPQLKVLDFGSGFGRLHAEIEAAIDRGGRRRSESSGASGAHRGAGSGAKGSVRRPERPLDAEARGEAIFGGAARDARGAHLRVEGDDVPRPARARRRGRSHAGEREAQAERGVDAPALRGGEPRPSRRRSPLLVQSDAATARGEGEAGGESELGAEAEARADEARPRGDRDRCGRRGRR